MSDQYGINEGVKTLTGSLDAARVSAKSLTKSIENVQKDGAEVAQQKAAERRKEQQFVPDTTVVKALKEYELVQEVKKMELRMKAEVVNKYGPKAWDDVLVNKKLFDADMQAVRRVQLYCFLVAAVVSYLIVWGDK